MPQSGRDLEPGELNPRRIAEGVVPQRVLNARLLVLAEIVGIRVSVWPTVWPLNVCVSICAS